MKHLIRDRSVLKQDEERIVTIREAIWQVKQAEQVAFASTLNGNGNACIVDVSRACALRNLQRSKHRGVKQVHLAEIFGTLVIGQ